MFEAPKHKDHSENNSFVTQFNMQILFSYSIYRYFMKIDHSYKVELLHILHNML